VTNLPDREPILEPDLAIIDPRHHLRVDAERREPLLPSANRHLEAPLGRTSERRIQCGSEHGPQMPTEVSRAALVHTARVR
jgi:hypothetical protein